MYVDEGESARGSASRRRRPGERIPTFYTLLPTPCLPPGERIPTFYTLLPTPCLPPGERILTSYTLPPTPCLPPGERIPTSYTLLPHSNPCLSLPHLLHPTSSL